MFDGKGEKILSLDSDYNSNSIHRWHYTSDIICCIKVRPALVMVLAHQ